MKNDNQWSVMSKIDSKVVLCQNVMELLQIIHMDTFVRVETVPHKFD